MPLIRDGSAVAIRSYHTDGQGAFSFETDRTADQLLVAKAAGHASSEIALNTTGTVAEINVHFRLRPAGTVMGRVENPTPLNVLTGRAFTPPQLD